MKLDSKILIVGYGNPYREDDGIGHIIAEAIEKWASEKKFDNITVITAYQLELEMVEDVAEHDFVVFIDAHVENYSKGIVFDKVVPKETKGFTTHVFGPSDLAALSEKFYNHVPEIFILSVPGYKFDLGDDLSEKTEKLSKKAIKLLKEKLMNF